MKMPNLKGWGHFQIMDSVLSVANELREEKRLTIIEILISLYIVDVQFLLNKLVVLKFV